jgi:hypothetical protein
MPGVLVVIGPPLGRSWKRVLDAIKVVLQVHDRKVRLFGLAAPVAVRVGPEPPTDVEFFEQGVELITAITSAPGGREELLRGLGHPGHACLTQSVKWLWPEVRASTNRSSAVVGRTGPNWVQTTPSHGRTSAERLKFRARARVSARPYLRASASL